ncbi:MAG: hypothetical protein C0494_05950 [Sphingobium sp.]|nr:hypothetical protein [Sphingobium sp.]
MSDDHTPRSGSRNQFYDEAADWFTKMRGPDADAHRDGFEAWLKRGALHRAAYNRIAEIFLDSDGSQDRAEAPREAKRLRLLPALCVILFAALCALSLSLLLPQEQEERADNRYGLNQPSVPAPVAYTTTVGEVRMLRLEDGSRITLDTDSLLSVDFSPAERRLRLLRGRARFDVAHEARAFRVAAGHGVITARGTIFDVRVEGDKAVSVQLLRGAIDVTTGAGPEQSRLLYKVQHLRPGQATSYTDRSAAASPRALPSDNLWPSARAEFADVPLAQVLAQANRYSLVPIELEGEDLAALKVSGIFSLRDTQKVAEKLAHLFGLQVRRETHRIALWRRSGTSRK